MKYSELLELYKQGKLEASKKEEIEYDIEKQEAISNYLYEEEVPTFDDLSNNALYMEQNNKGITDEVDVKFAKMIHRSIHKAFIKLGICIGATLLTILLFIQFALPHIISSFYYNPEKLVPGSSNHQSQETTQFTLDMAVYTELFVPESLRESTYVKNTGYGTYDFIIQQSASRNGNFTDVAGRITRNKILFYNTNIIKSYAGNAFEWCTGWNLDYTQPLSEQLTEDITSGCVAASKKGSIEAIKELDDNSYYNAYITLENIMKYADLIQYLNTYDDLNEIWCAPVTSEFSYDLANIGFFYQQASADSIEWNEQKYPYLRSWNIICTNKMKKESIAKQHFTDMLSYMNEQETFCKMMNVNLPLSFSKIIDYIEKNGLHIYGFMTTAKKSTLLELLKSDKIYSIHTTNIK